MILDLEVTLTKNYENEDTYYWGYRPNWEGID